jgi:hypothetical protein
VAAEPDAPIHEVLELVGIRVPDPLARQDPAHTLAVVTVNETGCDAGHAVRARGSEHLAEDSFCEEEILARCIKVDRPAGASAR